MKILKQIIFLLLIISSINIAQEWKTVAPMNTKRWLHASVVLANGDVLVTGGEDIGGIITSNCEIYSPDTDSWRVVDSMNIERYKHELVLLDDARVLAIGGYNELSCELFDPINETWTLTDSLILPRSNKPILAKLPNGNVLITGGEKRINSLKKDTYNSCEIYNVLNEKWIEAAPMNFARDSHSITKMQNGTLLVTGGKNSVALNSCEIYDPEINEWELVDSLTEVRYNHDALLLNNGNVLVSAGANNNDSTFFLTNTCEIYDADNNNWYQAGQLDMYHPQHSSFQLSDSTVLITGGENPNWEIFNLNKQLSTYSSDVDLDWFLQSHVRLKSSKIIKIGGSIWVDATVAPTNRCDIFDPNITSVKNNNPIINDNYVLFQNYPNPFNPVTNIAFYLPVASKIKLVVYNVLGEKIKTIIDASKPSGYHRISFDGSENVSGIYIYSLEINNVIKTKKMMIMK